MLYNSSFMSEEKHLTNLDLEKSTSRRSRKDEEGRDYQCGCGKRYLSYPALYTHIKTKHDGRQPEGTQKTGTSTVAKRLKGKQEDDLYKHLNNFLQRVDLKLLSQLDEQLLGSVSIPQRIKRDHVPKDVYEHFGLLTRQSDVCLSKNSCLDTVLAVYLWNVGQFVSEKLYDHYVLFARLVKGCFSELGEQVYRACFQSQPGFLEWKLTNIQEVQYVPIICDCLLRYYIPYAQSAKEFREVNLSLIELMMADFCIWLWKKQLTPIQTALNKDYKLQTKPLPLLKHRSHKPEHHKQKQFKESSLQESPKKQHSSEEHSEMEHQEELSPFQGAQHRAQAEQPADPKNQISASHDEGAANISQVSVRQVGQGAISSDAQH